MSRDTHEGCAARTQRPGGSQIAPDVLARDRIVTTTGTDPAHFMRPDIWRSGCAVVATAESDREVPDRRPPTRPGGWPSMRHELAQNGYHKQLHLCVSRYIVMLSKRRNA